MSVLHQYNEGCMLLLLLVVPAIFAGTCDLSPSNINRLIQRNNTILGAMNNTLINMTQTANSTLFTASTFQLLPFLTSRGASLGNLLQFVALGGLNLDWTSVTKNYTVKNLGIGELGAHILSVYVIPAHAALQDIAARYIFSYGLFRPPSNIFNYYALLDNATSSLGLNNLDSSCVAGKRYEITNVGSDLGWTSEYSNTSSSVFANLAYTVDTFFDKLLRGSSSAVANDFIRCNVVSASNCLLVVCSKVEVYLATDTDRTADLKNVLAPQSIFSKWPTLLPTNKSVTIVTGGISISFTSTITSTGTTTTTPSTTYTTTPTTVPTTVTAPSTASSTVTSSSSILTSTARTSTGSSSSIITQTISPTISQMTLQYTTITSLVSTPTTPRYVTPISTSASSTGLSSISTSTTSTSILLTSLTTSSTSLTSGIHTSSGTGLSTSTNIMNSSQTSKPIFTGSAQSTNASIAGTWNYLQNSTTSTLTPNTGPSFTSNTSGTSMQTMTTPSLHSIGFTVTKAQSSTSVANLSNSSSLGSSLLNSTISPLRNSTGPINANVSSSNSSTKPNYRSRTFDPDPLFLAEVPVITKVYNDDYLLRMQMGTMTPILEKATFYKVTIPAAIGLAALVFVCLVLLQIDCLQPPNKN